MTNVQSHRLTIVPNLEIDKVTWANSFLMAAKSMGHEIACQHISPTTLSVFLGDELPDNRPDRFIYYLAAASLGPAWDDESWRNEHENIRASFYTIVPSASERALILSHAPQFAHKVIALGFPILALSHAEAIRKTVQTKAKRVAFIASLTNPKNFDIQLDTICYLASKGYETLFFSRSDHPANARRLSDAGGQTCIGFQGFDYWRQLATCEYVCSVSAHESLSVSSIEAVALGAHPVLPAHSAFLDWCDPHSLYQPGSLTSLLSCFGTTRKTNYANSFKNLKPSAFFNGLQHLFLQSGGGNI